MDMQLYEPSPRFKHVMCATSDGGMYMWGGETAECYTKDVSTKVVSVIEHFDPYKEVWFRPTITMDTHPGFYNSAFCSFGYNLFMYGGTSRKDMSINFISGMLSQLDIKKFTWKVFSNAKTDNGRPMKKIGSGLVHFGHNKLAVIGGYGYLKQPVQPGSSVKQVKGDGRSLTNEFHILDIDQGIRTCEMVVKILIFMLYLSLTLFRYLELPYGRGYETPSMCSIHIDKHQ